jgi:hypothetical protein
MFHGTELCRLTAVYVPVAIHFHVATACCPSTKYDQKEEGMDGTHDQERASYSLCLGAWAPPAIQCKAAEAPLALVMVTPLSTAGSNPVV